MNSSKSAERLPRSIQNKQVKVGKWNDSLNASDVNQIWIELHRIVSSHPLVRASKRAGFLVEEGRYNAYTDLTQELFVQLLSKNRFEHYLETEMTDYEIECEISQIELTNLLTAELRKRHPESYRLARRISTLIQSSTNFRTTFIHDHVSLHHNGIACKSPRLLQPGSGRRCDFPVPLECRVEGGWVIDRLIPA